MQRRARRAAAFAALLTALVGLQLPACAQPGSPEQNDTTTGSASSGTGRQGRTGSDDVQPTPENLGDRPAAVMNPITGDGPRGRAVTGNAGTYMSAAIFRGLGHSLTPVQRQYRVNANEIIQAHAQHAHRQGQPPATVAPVAPGMATPALTAAPFEVGAQGPAMEILKEDPYEPTANMIVGTNLMWKGEHDKALPYFKNSIDAGREDSRTLTFAALSAYNAGDMEQASRWARDARLKDPEGPLSSQAEAIERLALKRLPKEEDPFAKRPPAGAGTSVPELERPIPPRKAEPGLPPETVALLADVNRLLAQASKAYRAGDMKEAARLAGQALVKDPDDVRALQVRAAAAAKEGDWTAVKKDADRALDMAPGYVPLLLLRAAAAVHAKDWRAAKADAGAVLAKEKANPTAWRFMGIAQSGLGEREESVTSLSRAVQYGDPEARRLLALARSLPPGADAADLVEMLANAADGLETASAARAAAPPPPARGLKTAVVFAAAVLTGVLVGGLIFLAGRKETESS